MSSSDDGTKVFKIGKSTIGFVYPEIYFQFVVKLNKEHPDLLRAMALAQVRFEDFTAIEFLNKILFTEVTKSMPMEIGFKLLYDALDRRSSSQIVIGSAVQAALKEKENQLQHQTNDGPLFPQTPKERKLDS